MVAHHSTFEFHGAPQMLTQNTPTSSTIKAASLVVATAITLVASPGAIAAEPVVITFPAGENTPASITLLQRQGNIGRDNAFYDNYRPQVQFSAEKQQVTCTVRVPQSQEKVEPGQTAEVALNCSEKFKIRDKERSFLVFEGGRKVAVGTIK